MNVSLEKTENGETFFDFLIEAEKFKKSIEKSYKKMLRNTISLVFAREVHLEQCMNLLFLEIQ